MEEGATRAFVAREKSVPASNLQSRLTALLGAHAAGNFKLKPSSFAIPKMLGLLRITLNLLCCALQRKQQRLDCTSVYNMAY
jgi:hypothetical protein